MLDQRPKRRPTATAEEIYRAESRERERIACLLHDVVGPLIVQIRLNLETCRGADPRPLDELVALVAELAQTVRHLTFDLGPPAWHGGLMPALEAVACDMAQRAGLDVRVEPVPADVDVDVPEPHRSIAFRAVRELCLNVHKHARARRVEIATRIERGWLCISVQDDGDGMAAPGGRTAPLRPGAGLGLASTRAQLRALGGELALGSVPGQGTCAHVLLPVGRAGLESGRTT